MTERLYHLALSRAAPHPTVDLLHLTWNDLRICFSLRRMNTQLFAQHFDQIRYWNWRWISKHMELDVSFIDMFCHYIDWERISRYQQLTPALVAKFANDISWADLSANPKLTFDLIGLYATRLDWGLVCKTIVFDEAQIRQFQRYVDWYELSLKSPLSEPFIEEHRDKVHWPRITEHQRLTNDFIDRNRDRVDWDYISRHRPMDRTFIEDHADYVDWGLISDGQELSEQFILDHRGRLDWEEIAYGQPISETFFEENAPKTPEVWVAFTAGRQLTSDFIQRNIAHLPSRELTRFQSFTLDEIDTYAAYLDWQYLSTVHTFSRPGSEAIDVAFVRRHADRIIWPRFVRTHVLPLELLTDFFGRFQATDIRQDIPLGVLRRNPAWINPEWIARNCPLTVEYLAELRQLMPLELIGDRHLPESVITTFETDLNLAVVPIFQPAMSSEWITAHAQTDRLWGMASDVAPRYWPLYASQANITRLVFPADEFFRRNYIQALATPGFFSNDATHILLRTMVSIAHLCPPERAAQIQLKCALNDLHVPSSWDYLDQAAPPETWTWLVRNVRLSEAFLRRFHYKVSWTLVSKYQTRPFSEQFVRDFHDRLVFAELQLPYDISRTYLHEFGRRHNWAMLTRDFQEWQMVRYINWCDFKVEPRKPLSEAFIASHYTFGVVAATQPLSEAYIARHDVTPWLTRLANNTKLILSQRFMIQHKQNMGQANWARVSNRTITTMFKPIFFAPSPLSQPGMSALVRYKLAQKGVILYVPAPPNLSMVDTPMFWHQYKVSEAIIRRFIQVVNWTAISQAQQLSVDFLDEFKDKVDWRTVSRSQRLPEPVIRYFKDYVHWPNICTFQKLSESFIAEFADRVSWEPLSPFSGYF